MTTKDYRICTTCRIHHYENCHTCFGFGVYRDEGRLIAITVADAHGRPPIYLDYVISNSHLEYAIACPECGSGLDGVPKGIIKSVPAKFIADTSSGPFFDAACPDCGYVMRLTEDWPEKCNCTKWIVKLVATRVEEEAG